MSATLAVKRDSVLAAYEVLIEKGWLRRDGDATYVVLRVQQEAALRRGARA